MTHRKMLFARAYAKNPDRREAILAAGYSESKWARTASRLLADRAVLAEIERQQAKAHKHEQAKPLTFADIIGDLAEMREAATDLPTRSGWSQRLRVNQVLGNLLSGRKEQPDPATDPGSQPLSGADVNQRIAELMQELGYVKATEPIRESVHQEMIPARSLTEVLNGQTSTKPPTTVLKDHPLPQTPSADAPEPPQDAKNERSESGAGASPVVNNFVTTEPDEKAAVCPNGHGEYMSRLKGDGTWSFCPDCVAAQERDEAYLASLAPAGDDRPENRGMPPGHMLHRRY